MRLQRDECKKLAAHAGRILTSDPKNTLKVQRHQILEAIEEALARHFEEEKRLDEEAQKLFDQTAGAQTLDRGKALSMIRKQLAKQKNFVLSGSPTGERLTEDKIMHLAHLVADKLFDDDLMDFPHEDDGIKEVKKIFIEYFHKENALDQKVRAKLLSLSSPPFEGSDEWETLYRKYFEEEMRRLGHGSDQ